MKLYEARHALRVNQSEGMDSKALHHAVATRNSAVGHDPHHHVSGFWRQRDEVPKAIVRRLRLRDFFTRAGLHSMDEIRKFHAILNEKNWHVIAD